MLTVAAVVVNFMLASAGPMHVGQTAHYSVTIEFVGSGAPPAGDFTPKWFSTNPNVVQINATGDATAVAVGDAEIQGRVNDQAVSQLVHVVP